MTLTLLLGQHVAGHVDADGMDTSVAPADDFLAFTSGACSPRAAPPRELRHAEGRKGIEYDASREENHRGPRT
ncbi:hypothetical protein WMF20_07700 [Sorangium sp. So ce834]|uniref:hypothetical protein n=1 Tax=Sorangium sp. So ce834 TaxID=3133321 RepID=UPI003F5F2A25